MNQHTIDPSVAAMGEVSKRYWSDSDYRDRINGEESRDLLMEAGLHIPQGMEVKIAADDIDTIHLVMPADPNVDLSDEGLEPVSGGDTAGSASSVGTAGSFATSSLVSTISSAGSAGTAGSAG